MQLGLKAWWRTGSRIPQFLALPPAAEARRIPVLRNQSRLRNTAALRASEATSRISFFQRCRLRDLETQSISAGFVRSSTCMSVQKRVLPDLGREEPYSCQAHCAVYSAFRNPEAGGLARRPQVQHEFRNHGYGQRR